MRLLRSAALAASSILCLHACGDDCRRVPDFENGSFVPANSGWQPGQSLSQDLCQRYCPAAPIACTDAQWSRCTVSPDGKSLDCQGTMLQCGPYC